MTDNPVRLGIEIDKQSQQTTNAAVDALTARFAKTAAMAHAATEEAQKTAKALADAFKDTDKALDKADKAFSKNVQTIADLRKELLIQPLPNQSPDKLPAQGGSVEGSRAFFGSAASLLGGSGGEVLRTTEELNRLKYGFGQLTKEGIGPLIAQLGPLAIVAGGAIAAIAALNESLKTSREEYTRALDAQKLYNKASEENTTAGIQAQIAALNAQKAVAYKNYEDQKRAYDAIQNLSLGDKVLASIGQISQKGLVPFSDELDKAGKAIRDDQANIDALTRALQSDTVAANDAALAVERSIKFKELTINAESMSSAAIQERLKKIEQSVPAEEAAIAQLRGQKEQTEAVTKEIAVLVAKHDDEVAEYKILRDAILAKVQAQELETQQTNTQLSVQQQLAQIRLDGENLIATATSKSVQDRIAANGRERASNVELWNELTKIQNPTKEVTDAIAKLENRIQYLDADTKNLTSHVLPLIIAREQETAQLEKQQKAMDAAFQKIQQRNKDLASAQEKYETDVNNIQSASLQKRADIEQKYADTLVSIAQDASQKAQDRLDKLNQDRAEKTLALARDEENATLQASLAEIDIKIKAQRDERNALQDHLRTLENIRANAKLREQTDLLNRNFLGVLQSRMQMSADIGGENQKFVQGQQDRAQATRDQLDDLRRTQEQERAARLKAYQQQLADAQAAYQRETAQASKDRALAMAKAQIDRNKALAEEEQGRVQSLAALRKQHVQELQDIYDFGARKLKAERDFLQAAINMIAAATPGARVVQKGRPTQSVTQFADGGDIGANEWGLVQEGRQREAFNGIPFPSPGAGMFYPLQGGTISHVSNSTTNTPVQNTFNIPGAQNPNEIARVVVDVMKKVISR